MHMRNSKTEERALIDSGATENFLDYQTIKRLDLGTKLLETPWPIINADGSPNGKGSLMRCTELMVTQNRKEALQWFFVADLGSNQMILGFPWLHKWNPDIDWRKWNIKGGPISTRTLWTLDWAKIGLLSYQAQHIAHNYHLMSNDAVYIQINQINVVQQWAIKASKGKELVKVLQEYQDFEDIFSDEKAKQLPPTRGEFNHQIKFKTRVPETIKCKVYPMNQAETEFTRN